MRLCAELVSETANVVRNSGSVPFPGGHGVWFPDFRSRYSQVTGVPKLEARCYVGLILLGDGDGEQRWNPKEWWPHALVWFDLYCPDIASRLDGPRWAYLLAAMLQVVESWLERQPEHRHLIAFAADCHGRAEERLRQMTRGKQAKDSLFSFPVRTSGFVVGESDERWRSVADEFDGPNAAVAEMLFFMHVLHSQLGVAQHSLDERYATRVPFYRQLQRILEQGTGLSNALRDTARRVSKAMSTTALLATDGAAASPRALLSERLPECFQVAHHLSRPPPRALLELQLAYAPAARDRLLLVHDLGTAVADLIIDIFRSGGTDGPAFRPGSYDYLHSLIRYGPKMYEEHVKRSAQPFGANAVFEKSAHSGVPMTRSFAERMRSGLLVDPARKCLALDLGQEISDSIEELDRAGAASNDRGAL